MTFTKDPSTHLANGPLTEERLICVREWLQSSLAYSGGSNRDYMMADAAKAIEELLALREREPVARRLRYKDGPWLYKQIGEDGPAEECHTEQKLYAAPQLPQPAVVPLAVSWEDVPEEITEDDMGLASAWAHGFNQCRAAMLQGKAEPVQSWIPCSERMPDETQPVIVVSDGGVVQRTVYQFCEGVWIDWYEQYDEVNADEFTHWMPLPAAPQQEVK